jgi:hypothetical protein
MENRRNAFDNWPEPRGSASCPPESKLAEWILNPESAEARAHLAECKACAAAIENVRQAGNEARGNLDAFMRDVRMRAQLEAEQHSSKWEIFVNYFTASRAQTVGALAAAPAVTLIATSGVWRHFGLLQSHPPADEIVMDRDSNGESYRQAVIGLRDSYSMITSGNVSRGNTAAQIDKLNEVLGRVDKNRLQPEQKQQLEALQAEYQALVFDRLQPNLSSSQGGAKARNLQADFFSTYASYLAQGGEQLTVSPEISVKSSKTKMYVIAHPNVPDAKKIAADRAVRELQHHVSDMSLEYRPAGEKISETQPD